MKVIFDGWSGGFPKLEAFLNKSKKNSFDSILNKYGREGVDALSSATPVRTGLTASSWGYEVSKTNTGCEISYTNSNINEGVPIAVIIQYGHGTRNGGYVPGNNYVNPAIKPVFEDIEDEITKEVTE